MQKAILTSRTTILTILTVSILINVSQARYIWLLRDREVELAATSLRTGSKMTELKAQTMDGSKILIPLKGNDVPTILYVFRPTCHWCNENAKAVHALAEQTSGRYRMIGLSLSALDLAPCVSSHSMNFPIYANPSVGDREAYHLGATPQTIVVSSAGEVLRVFNGAYQMNTKLSIQKTLNVSLP